MLLQVKTKVTIDAVVKGKKKPCPIQEVGPYVTLFNLPHLMAFTDDDVKYIMSAVPEYDAFVKSAKAYVETLEGDKSTVLSLLQAKYKSLMDTSVMDMKIQINVSRKHKLIFDGGLKVPYKTDIPQYDPFDNNHIQ